MQKKKKKIQWVPQGRVYLRPQLYLKSAQAQLWGAPEYSVAQRNPRVTSLPESLWAFLSTGYLLMYKEQLSQPWTEADCWELWPLFAELGVVCDSATHIYSCPEPFARKSPAPLPFLVTALPPDRSDSITFCCKHSGLQLSRGWKKVSVDNYFPGVYQGKWLCKCHLQAIFKM